MPKDYLINLNSKMKTEQKAHRELRTDDEKVSGPSNLFPEL